MRRRDRGRRPGTWSLHDAPGHQEGCRFVKRPKTGFAFARFFFHRFRFKAAVERVVNVGRAVTVSCYQTLRGNEKDVTPFWRNRDVFDRTFSRAGGDDQDLPFGISRRFMPFVDVDQAVADLWRQRLGRAEDYSRTVRADRAIAQFILKLDPILTPRSTAMLELKSSPLPLAS